MKNPSRREFFKNSLAIGATLALPVPLITIGEEKPVIRVEEKYGFSNKILDLAPARWVWFPSKRCLPNTIVLFRKEVILQQTPAHAKGWILGDSRYKFYVNGERIQFGPAPADPRWSEADPIDLQTYLQVGKNIIGTEVLYYGHGDGTWPIGKPGFIFYLELEFTAGEKTLIVSDGSWQTSIAQSWRPGQYKRWYLRAFQEEFNAVKYPYGWNTPSFSTNTSWRQVMLLEGDADKPSICTRYDDYLYDSSADPKYAELRARSITLSRETNIPIKQLAESMWLKWKQSPEEYFEFVTPDAFEIIREASHSQTVPGTWEVQARTSEYAAVLTFEFAEQIVGFPYFTIDASEGTIVELLVHEAHKLGTDALINTHFHSWTRFICKEGINHFETFDYESLRWLQLHIRLAGKKVSITNVGLRRRMFDWQNKPNVQCSDAAIQKVINASINTLYNCAIETIVDGMGRERQQYSGDLGHVLHAVFLTMGEPGMAARFLNTFSQGITAQGFFLDCWPAFDRLARLMERELQLTPWGPLLDHGVAFNFDCFHYYLYTGEVESIREVFPRLIKFYNYLNGLLQEDGLLPVENIGVPTVWIDNFYERQRHKQCAFNLYASAMMVHALAPLCIAFGERKLAEQVLSNGGKILNATIQKFWSDADGLFVNNFPWLKEEKNKRLCDRSLATALLFNQCPGGNTKVALKTLIEVPPAMGLSYPGNAIWRYWALSKFGDDTFIKDIRERWSNTDSVKLNNTLAEDWDVKPDSGSQWSHSPISPLFGMHMFVAGIRPSKPGFEEVEIAPMLGTIENLSITTQTVKGPIQLTLQQSKNKLIVSIELPESMKGVFKWKEKKYSLVEGSQKLVI